MRHLIFSRVMSKISARKTARPNTWRRLCAATGGNVTITFALAFIPLIGLTGAAVDYSRAATIRTAMQAAADASALALSKSAAGTKVETDLSAQATTYFNAIFTRADAKNMLVTATYTPSPAKVVVSATANMDTSIMGVLGFSQLQLGVNSTTAWGQTRLRVALVLDNTGSMGSSGKLTALKNATKNLLTQLNNAATTSDDVYVSIIPFAKDINVDKTNYSENWIYWGTAAQDPTPSDDSSWDASYGTCSAGNYSPRSRCFQQPPTCSLSRYNNQSSCTSAAVCSNPRQTTQSTCAGQKACSTDHGSQNGCENHGGIWDLGTWQVGVWSRPTWTPDDHNTWNGCITDRGDRTGPNAGNYDINTAAADAVANGVPSLFPAEQYGACPAKVMPLSNDWASMNTTVTNMTDNGSTNQGIGLVHGWQSLVGGGPYPAPPTEDSKYNYKKIIILLTDGLNTQNRWFGDGSHTGTADTDKIDAREQLTCDGINAAKITLYTVQVNTGSPPDPKSTVLQNCAGTGEPRRYPDPSKYFQLTTAEAIVTTFREIGDQISRLHVAF